MLNFFLSIHESLSNVSSKQNFNNILYISQAVRVELKPYTTILVHGGAGALGQAVISIALAHKCQIFTTVSSNTKKRFLCKLYPDLKGIC